MYIYIYIYTHTHTHTHTHKVIYKSYNPTSKCCNLCLTEKLEILDDPDKNLLNKRSEIISQCHHKNKYRLKTLASSLTSGGIT